MKQQAIRTSIVLLLSTGVLPSSTLAESDDENLENRLRAVEQALVDRDEPDEASSSDTSLNLYGTFRPTFAFYADENDEELSDVRDALSRVGLNGSVSLTPNINGIFEGEWSVDIQTDGNFGRARKAYVGLEGGFGKIAIGKQRPPQYTLIAEHVDIFNHANSPFAYDVISPFFIDNAVTYGLSGENFDVLALGQFNGDAGEDHADVTNVGAAFHTEAYYVAVSYFNTTLPDEVDSVLEGDEITALAVAAYANWGPVYLAGAYQDLEFEPRNAGDRDGHTFDISAAYDLATLGLANGYKVKVGFFQYDDGVNDDTSLTQDGANVTLEYQWTEQFRVHLEYLERFFDERPDDTSFTVGFRYDFDISLL